MEAVLRLWFNGAREYYTGVALLRRAAPGNGAIRLLSTGPSSYNTPRLLDELQQVLDELQGNVKAKAPPIIVRKASPVISAPADDLPAANQPLYDACITDARKAYKEAMNLRAELFAMAKPDMLFNEVNLPDMVRKRSPLAIDVVRKYNEASRLFDVADHARTTGRLAADVQEEAVEEYADLPDIMVKPTLDNLRKNYNKIKKRPVTPERTVLIQKHEKSIERLKLRWDKINGI